MAPMMLVFALLCAAARAAAEDNTNTTAVVWQPNYEHLGAWVGSSLESSPLFFKGNLYLMASRMGRFPRDGSNGSHSYFCIMDGRTGEEVSCPPTSSGHAFCSSIVDHTGPAERVWVFCSAWDRANQTSCKDPLWGCGACGLRYSLSVSLSLCRSRSVSLSLPLSRSQPHQRERLLRWGLVFRRLAQLGVPPHPDAAAPVDGSECRRVHGPAGFS